MFDGHYDEWRKNRINKIISILGQDFFKNKTLLELAAGTGKNGKIFESFGAKVTYAEARREHLLVLLRSDLSARCIELDQDKEWNLNEKFDIILHWGVLYHLNNWKQDLECAAKHSNLILLESEVCRSNNPTFEIKTQESGPDQAFNLKGSRPSSAMIEAHLQSLGLEFRRFDDEDLNSVYHNYSWEVPNPEPNDWIHGYRRFWIVTRNKI